MERDDVLVAPDADPPEADVPDVLLPDVFVPGAGVAVFPFPLLVAAGLVGFVGAEVGMAAVCGGEGMWWTIVALSQSQSLSQSHEHMTCALSNHIHETRLVVDTTSSELDHNCRAFPEKRMRVYYLENSSSTPIVLQCFVLMPHRTTFPPEALQCMLLWCSICS
jgi:hypothetical protein